MIEWRDEGALLKVRKHGENSAIIEVFTPDRGLTAGIVRGGTSRKIAPLLQPGAQLDVTWKARLEDHLGSFTVEPVRSRTALVMQDRLALAGLNAVTGILSFVLPDREKHAPLYCRTVALLDLLGQNDVWPLAYLQWEVALLEEMGFGMDLSACAVSGLNDDLFYVSPRTGRAVSRLAAGDWADRLLPLPHVLLGKGDADIGEIVKALRTTGHFLNNHLAKSLGNRQIPEARQRLIDTMKRLA
ncbi:MAG: DNA repair protein RecO [Octadecabacter sp.]